jgi:hypothetical protein
MTESNMQDLMDTSTDDGGISETARHLREVAEHIENPAYHVGLAAGGNQQGSAYFEALKNRLKGEQQREFEANARGGVYSSHDDMIEDYNRLLAHSTPASPASTTAPSSQSRQVMSMREAERRYVLPQGHREKISHAQFKVIRKAHGVRD